MRFLTGEPLALDLLNTRAHTPNGEIDALDTGEDFQFWLEAQADRLTPLSAVPSDADRAAVRQLREYVAEAVEQARQGARPSPETVEALNLSVRSAPRYTVATWDGERLVAEVRRDGDERDRLLAGLAEAAVELLTDPDVVKVRGCEGPHCTQLFLPAHPRRRWCSPALCGNRVRVARYHQRHNG
ncbi:CGNR zinc finger domain-containing protein [Rhodococcus sp. MTM3W5.2]|uniref:CGNR zinc finger domain-containing protein n=1 Tax=Rhodococcus sp. MTM3W5.2 TaxID=1805827 RepID=UPI00097C7584|nr:ABATE domain-containing protein [Rhodococcus sp. MTM3W5.2]